MRIDDPYIQRRNLDVGILVPYPPLQSAHGFLRLHRFGADYICDLEVEGDVLSVESSA